MDVDGDRYVEVQSLYSPGTVGAWLLTVLAVAISWTLNAKSRRRDSISIDLLAVLTMPAVAAGHVFYQVAQLPFTLAETITARDTASVQQMAAIEAPLNICETFTIIALALASCCGPFHSSGVKYKRLTLILVVGLLCWATEELFFERATRKGVSVAEAMVSRPYVFLLTPIVGTVWGFLGICLVVVIGFAVVSLIVRWQRRVKQDHEHANPSISLPTLHGSHSASQGGALPADISMGALDLAERPSHHGDIASANLAALGILFLPISVISSVWGMSIFDTGTQAMDAEQGRPRKSIQPFFIPNSAGSLTDLDQALTLATGGIVLTHACSAAWSSRYHQQA
ncbi:Hypothetical protein D9617_19g102680 [Elsinoe fawcettii]|nr:Hypothetical protein D9617_19g102680 [Elsinoe fawcettii]